MEECQLQQGLCGFYYEPKHLIVIDETMLDFQKRCTLCHELVHAHNHDQGCSPYGSKAERRARLYTALRLINPHEYAIAERMYGADSYLIACELDVTVQVIEDYKNWLQVVPEFLRTLVFARPRGDDQFADCTFSPSLDMSR